MKAAGFTGAGLDRADDLRMDPGKIAELASRADARLLRLAGSDPVPAEDGSLEWEALADQDAGFLIFLGLDGERPLFAPLRKLEPGASSAFPLFDIIDRLSSRDAAIWGAARSLIHWHSRHGFCSNCGAATLVIRAGWARRCPACSSDHFPRVDPVVIMLAEYEGRVLVGRQPHYPKGRYSALAGFVEPGESFEEAVARELREEAGITVEDVRYVASQPWPFPGSLMIACIARAHSDRLVIDHTELEDAYWIDREGVRASLAREPGAPFNAPPPFAIAHTLFDHWLGLS